MAATLLSHAQNIPAKQLDQQVNRALHTFNVPGISVAIVKDGRVVYAKGYGWRSLMPKAPVNENTLFGIASNSKAFTTAALGILVDEGKLKWDDKLIDYLPEFRMYDPCTTADFTIRDMLTHRSGLGLGAGDLLHNPDSSNFTIKDVIYSLRYLKPEAPFRSRYAYDNIFYLVAGELIARVSGMSWGDFIEKRIMQPLQMTRSGASYRRVKHEVNIIDGYFENNGQLQAVVRTDDETDAGAGGIYASAADMAQWMLLQLNNGKYGPGLTKQLFSEAVHRDMWTPQVFIPASKGGVYNTHFGAYGLGWFLIDLKGYEQVSHTGQDGGMISEVSLIPDLHMGITVLSNQEGGGAVRAIIDQVTDYYVGVAGTDRVKEWANKVKSQKSADNRVISQIRKDAALRRQTATAGKTDLNLYTGRYHDHWFGDVDIYLHSNQLWFRSKRSPQLTGPMLPYKGSTFLVRWNNPQINADAFVIFDLDETGNASRITMKRASPGTSFAYDFQDLNFQRVDSNLKE